MVRLCWTADWMVRVRALAGSLAVLCSWARHIASFHQVHKWVPANLLLGVTL